MLVTYIRKTGSVGPTWIPPSKSTVKLHHLLLYFPALLQCPGRKFPMLIGQVAFVHYQEMLVGEVYQPRHVNVLYQCPADVIDLSAAIFKARVGQEKGGAISLRPRRDVDQVPAAVLPDSMKFRLDEDPWRLPDGPAYKLFSTLSDHLLWNDAEAFARWFVTQGFVWDSEGCLVRSHMAAEVQDMG